MLKNKKEIFDAVKYLKNNSSESLIFVAIKFGADRHTYYNLAKNTLNNNGHAKIE